MRFAKAQIISYKDIKSMEQYQKRNVSKIDISKPIYYLKNYILSPGTTSYWTIAHWFDNNKNNTNSDSSFGKSIING